MAANPADSELVSRSPAMVSRPAFRLSGSIEAPGDKSISHRAIILGALATGTTHIQGLLESADTMATVEAMRALGAKLERVAPGNWNVTGVGVNGFRSPVQPLDFGNAGTGVRLGFGLVGGQNISAKFVGDASLSKRPMGRVLAPLAQMGVKAISADGCLPVQLSAVQSLQAIHHVLPVASAQVKSAILLAGLRSNGQTIIDEPGPSRDHTENMLRAFGADLHIQPLPNNARRVVLQGPVQLQAQNIKVPGDPSSAAFAMIAALIIPNSDITITNVMVNPTRNGLVRSLQAAGYDLCLHNQRTNGGENIADIRVLYGCCAPVCPDPELAVTMIDEYPALILLAAFATGTSRFAGIGELRVKESDRIAKMAELLTAHGVHVRTGDDWMEVDGKGSVFGPVVCAQAQKSFAVAGDHRIAMCALLLGMAGYHPVAIDDRSTIATSYPEFIKDMAKLGAQMSVNSNQPKLVIAVDGPSAAGKGTLARKLAAQFDLPYLDTGLLYRATARAALAANIALDDETKLASLAQNLSIPILQPEQLRSFEIGAAASKIAVIASVRSALLALQQDFANGPHGAVLDGRDIGTVICPDADIKFWITASEDVRAARRREELQALGQQISQVEMLSQLRERDTRDAARNSAPMQKPANAYLIDTSKLRIDAALHIARKRIEQELAERGRAD